MDTYQIDTILREELGDCFLGVFARDQIPLAQGPRAQVLGSSARRPMAMVVNTHPAHLPGEYFDSYGLPPPLDFERILDRCTLHYTFNRHQLQDYFSFVCGQYCIYYLYHRHRGQSLSSICDDLRKEGDKNDCIVAEFVSQRYGLEPSGCGQTCGCLRDYMYK